MTQPPLSLRDIDVIVFDFDGVLTDNRVLVFEDGREAVSCNRSDGLACDILRAAGVPLFILSKERNPVVSARGRKLDIPVVQSVDDKAAALSELCAARGFDPARTIFVGNDTNDLPAMAVAGYPIAVADAHPNVLAAAWRILETRGGDGAAREILDRILTLEEDTQGP